MLLLRIIFSLGVGRINPFLRLIRVYPLLHWISDFWVEADWGVVIVVISRLYYNKGIDLLVAVIPRICTIHPSARFIIAGDGPKFLALEEMREKYMLQDRVEMLGSIRHEEVRDVQTSIFLPLQDVG
jgi:glycosyltransferase involved in cell wall biosynthesis